MTTKPRITIIGLGLVGTSLGLALRQMATEFEIVGHDKDNGAAGAAKKKGAVDRTHWNLPSSCEGASLIFLALPLSEIRSTMEVIAPDLQPGTVVTDTANLKASVIAWADELLPEGVSFVGGNPIIQAGGKGRDAASADLFRRSAYCLAASPKASDDALALMANLVSGFGAKPLFIDAAEHDGLITAVEHLPAILAASLLDLTAGSDLWRDMRRLAGGSYQDTTSLPSQHAAPLRDMCQQNATNIARWLDNYIQVLQDWKAMIASGDGKRMEAAFEEVTNARIQWMLDRTTTRWETEELGAPPKMPSTWQSLLLGQMASRPRKRR